MLALAELELILGDRAAARKRIALVDATHRGELRMGRKVDAGMVVIEADHLDLDRAVALGRRAWSAAPSVSSADALGTSCPDEADAPRSRTPVCPARIATRFAATPRSCITPASPPGRRENRLRRDAIWGAAVAARTLSPLHERKGARSAQRCRALGVGQFGAIDELRDCSARAEGVVPGVVAMVADRDGVVYQGRLAQGRGRCASTDTMFRIASMTKALTSVAALRLIEQSRLALDQRSRR